MSVEDIYEYWKTSASFVPNRFDIAGGMEGQTRAQYEQKYINELVGGSEAHDELDKWLENPQYSIDSENDMHIITIGADMPEAKHIDVITPGHSANKTASTVESGLKEMFARMKIKNTPRKKQPPRQKKHRQRRGGLEIDNEPTNTPEDDSVPVSCSGGLDDDTENLPSTTLDVGFDITGLIDTVADNEISGDDSDDQNPEYIGNEAMGLSLPGTDEFDIARLLDGGYDVKILPTDGGHDIIDDNPYSIVSDFVI